MNLAEVVRALLEQVQPDNVDSSAPIVSGEGPDVEIVIVPHRDLDEVSVLRLRSRLGRASSDKFPEL